MSFLQKFLAPKPAGAAQPSAPGSFRGVSEEELSSHLAVRRYGEFELTDAVRPSYDLSVVPRAGYRRDSYVDADSGVRVPVLMAAASREVLFDLFLDLLDPLGEEVDVVLETSHDTRARRGHRDLCREHIDLPVLKSTLLDYEDTILDDGCLGVAVLNPRIPLEVQFDEHKLLVMYGADLFEFEKVLFEHRLKRDDEIKFLTEGEHVHSSSDEFAEEFEQLCYRLGAEQ